MNQQPTPGRMVNFVLHEGRSKGGVRPAMIVKVWGEGCVSLQVFTDGQNANHGNDGLPGVLWVPSVNYSEQRQERTWHWPQRI
jgi:hypothetical protein